MPLFLSAAMFTVFALNVVLGSMSGTVFLSDVGEALVLFAASAVFVAAILIKEATRKNADGE